MTEIALPTIDDDIDRWSFLKKGIVGKKTMTKIEADIKKRIKKFKPFDPEKLRALNDKIEKDENSNDEDD